MAFEKERSLREMRRKLSLRITQYCFGTRMEGLSKTTYDVSWNSRYPGRDTNQFLFNTKPQGVAD
jgi:hypothetical protein